MNDGKGEPFTCAWCQGQFTRARGDDEALAEYKELWEDPDLRRKDLVLICDGCHQKLTAAYPPAMVLEDVAAGIQRTIQLSD